VTILSNTLQRDVEALLVGMKFTFMAGPLLRASGWVGGVWVQFVDAPEEGNFVVEVSDGNHAIGFILAESEHYARYYEAGSPDNYTSYQKRLQGEGPNTVDVILGGGIALFRRFETIALNAGTRNGGPLLYTLNDWVKVSENGLYTSDPDIELNAVGIANPISVGIVAALPTALNGFRLGVMTNYP
jgi:hypothetical protein